MFVWKRPKINEKEAGVGPFFLKKTRIKRLVIEHFITYLWNRFDPLVSRCCLTLLENKKLTIVQSSVTFKHCLHWPDNTYHRITLRLVSTFNKTEFDQKENMLLLFVSSSVSSWIQTCKTGDQTHSDSFPNGECSLHWHWYLLLWFVCTSIQLCRHGNGNVHFIYKFGSVCFM